MEKMSYSFDQSIISRSFFRSAGRLIDHRSFGRSFSYSRNGQKAKSVREITAKLYPRFHGERLQERGYLSAKIIRYSEMSLV